MLKVPKSFPPIIWVGRFVASEVAQKWLGIKVGAQ